ncbi:MAG: 3'-5' exonuclease [Candidatus Omnitrophota bacterium]|nr:3'-5' exonuclease [Candidatus Omnitrophota bacterium]
MLKNIDEVELTIFDTETTGLYPDAGDRIVELAGLRVKGKERISTFDMLMNPMREISSGAFAVNKITPDLLKDALGAQVVIPNFLNFISGSCLCSYNAEFDLNFVNNELKLLSCPPINNNIVVFDVLTMAKKLMPNLARYALWFVAKELGVQTTQKHRAFSDVEMTWEVFTKLKTICEQRGITNFTDFSSLFAVKPKI